MFEPLKNCLPRSLLARSLLIMLVPLLIAQGVAFELFYGRNLNFVSRRFSQAVAGEIATTIDGFDLAQSDAERKRVLEDAERHYFFEIQIIPNGHLVAHPREDLWGPMDDSLATSLAQNVPHPTEMDWRSDPVYVIVKIQLDHALAVIKVPQKRLVDNTLLLFLGWVSGSSALFYLIAALFMRNQVRAIHRLAKAADSFGRGQDRGPIKLEGATEVRLAAAAFNRMQERIHRFLSQRTEMLAGVSHDLRTPLTRLRLAIAMLPDQGPDTADMATDIDEMDRMIGAYLAFARGEGEEQPQTIELDPLLDEIAQAALRAGTPVERGPAIAQAIRVRPDALRRAITNLVSNATRHARHVRISAETSERSLSILIDDNGPGMPETMRESAFRPVLSNSAGGTGLGLAIARDIARSHGGDIRLESSPLGGLRARIRLPVSVG